MRITRVLQPHDCKQIGITAPRGKNIKALGREKVAKCVDNWEFHWFESINKELEILSLNSKEKQLIYKI
jgi:hypothetical protein